VVVNRVTERQALLHHEKPVFPISKRAKVERPHKYAVRDSLNALFPAFWMEQTLGWTAQTVQPPPRRVLVAEELEPTPRPAFTVLPRRWAVEQPFAWVGQNRRLSKDYERLCESSEAMVEAAMSRLMLRRFVMPQPVQTVSYMSFD
jgi:transposase